MDSFTLPIKELLHDHSNNNNIINNNGEDDQDHDHNHELHQNDDHESRHVLEGKETEKSKSFSLFAMLKWRKDGGHNLYKGDDNQQTTQKWKSKFELLKRYVRFVKPFLSQRNRRLGNSDEFLQRQPHLYSRNLRVRNKRNLIRGRRGEFLAPASMRTSPANSGLLVVASRTSTPTTKNDSTMEELLAVIQAAIAHCKMFIAADDKIKLSS